MQHLQRRIQSLYHKPWQTCSVYSIITSTKSLIIQLGSLQHTRPSSVQRGCNNTASPSFLSSVFLLVMTAPPFLPSNPPVDLLILSLPYLTSCLSSDVIVEKLSSNLHSMMFQKWTTTSLKYLIPVYLVYSIHPFKAFYRLATFHHVICISPPLPFTKMSLLKEFFLYLIPVLYHFYHQNELFPHFLLFCVCTSMPHLLYCTHKSHPFSSN